MERHNQGEYLLLFKALSDETRLQIVEMLSCGEMCACDILEFFKFTQPTLSYHMKILTDCGLIHHKKDGSWIRYSINIDRVNAVNDFWKRITSEQLNCICNDCTHSECK